MLLPLSPQHHQIQVVAAQQQEQFYFKQPVLLTIYTEQLPMVVVVPIMILFLVEQFHQESLLAQQSVVLMDLMEAVKVELNIEQELVLEQIAQHIHKHSLELVAPLVVDPGAPG
jgi:hypothetical protein